MMRFDMRAPSFGASSSALYAEALEMAAWADQHWINRLFLSEHHGSDDGYCPAPVVLGGAMAARTSRIRILWGSVILPFHHPLHVAEQVTVLDLVSNGRAEVAVALGYVPREFQMSLSIESY
jgi:alkanesulfonate monooxygenase SsuD/methylene tetrahydromethanopterin reductase-like flavin-dependent oxidoreductase (luciferase family)